MFIIHIADIPLRFATMSSARSKQLYRTTSTPLLRGTPLIGSSDPEEALRTAILDNRTTQTKISLDKLNAIKSQEKARDAFKSTIEIGTHTSAAVRQELQTVTLSLNEAMTWTQKLMEAISKVSNTAEVNALTENEANVRVVRLRVDLTEAKKATEDTTEGMKQQMMVLTEIVRQNITKTVHLANTALEEATTAVIKTFTWFRTAAKAESQGMMIAETLASSTSAIHESRAKAAALDTAKEIMEVQTATQIWNEVKDRAQKTTKAWTKAADAIKSTIKAIRKAANQIEIVFKATMNALDKEMFNARRGIELNVVETLVKSITRTVTSAQATIRDATAHINVCEQSIEHATTAITELRSLIYPEEKSSDIQTK
jgi:hypothetical protein